nr:uncharacterized protein LOC111515859 [Leptinotarsa decemlineata]
MKPIRNATAQAITTFLEKVVLTFGVSQVLLLDNATAHKGKVFNNFIEEYKIPKVTYTCRYQPNENPTERNNRAIGTATRCFIKDSHKQWDEEILKIQHAINTATHEVTGFSPDFLNFGRTVPAKGEYYGDVIDSDWNNNSQARKMYSKELEKLPSVYFQMLQMNMLQS